MVNIRFFNKGDEDQIVNLISNEDSLGNSTKFDKNFWNWKYNHHNSIKSLVAIDKEIVGHIGILERKLLLNNKEIKAAQITDIIVSKSNRNLGLFRKLLKNIIKRLQDKKIELIYVTPNDNSFPGLVSEGFLPIREINEKVQIFNSKNSSVRLFNNKISQMFMRGIFNCMNFRFSNYNKMSSTGNHVIREINGEQLDSFFLNNPSISECRFDVKKDFFKWRYDDHPSNKYTIYSLQGSGKKILSYLILGHKSYISKNNLLVCNVMDFFSLNDIDGLFLFNHVMNNLDPNKVEMVRLYVENNSDRMKIFKKFNFWKYRKQKLLAYICNKESLSYESLKNNNFHFMLGDTDHA